MFFNGLAHGVAVEGDELAVFILAPEQFQGLVLGRGGEGEVGDVGLLLAGLHLADDFILGVDFVPVGLFRFVQANAQGLVHMSG